MAFTVNFQFEKPDYRTLRFDIPFNESLDKLDAALKGWPSATAPGTSPNYDEIVLTEGVQWRNTSTHRSEVYGQSVWEIIHTNSYASAMKNTMSVPTAVANESSMYCADVSAGIAAPHFLTENNKIIKLYRQNHIADVDSTVIVNLANLYGTANGTLEDIGATNSSDVSGAIENNFKECTTEITNLKYVVDDLRFRVNSILTYLENLGLTETSGGLSPSISPSVSASRSPSISASISASISPSVSASRSESVSESSSPSA